MDAAGGVGASAVAECDAAALEVAEELFPLGVGGGAVFLAGAQLPPSGDVGAVAVDGFLGVGGLWRSQISQLSSKSLRKSWGLKMRGLPSVPVMPAPASALVR